MQGIQLDRVLFMRISFQGKRLMSFTSFFYAKLNSLKSDVRTLKLDKWFDQVNVTFSHASFNIFSRFTSWPSVLLTNSASSVSLVHIWSLTEWKREKNPKRCVSLLRLHCSSLSLNCMKTKNACLMNKYSNSSSKKSTANLLC